MTRAPRGTALVSKVGWCRLSVLVSNPELKERLVSALESKM
jgi:hypothetical protein